MRQAIVAAALLLLPAPVRAQTDPFFTDSGQDPFAVDVSSGSAAGGLTAEQLDYAASVIRRARDRARRIAERFGAKPDTVAGLRRRGLGYEELVRLFLIAGGPGPGFEKAARMRTGKAGFDRICAEFGAEPKAVRRKAAQILTELEID